MPTVCSDAVLPAATVARNKKFHAMAPDVIAESGKRRPDDEINLIALKDYLRNDPLKISEEQAQTLQTLNDRWDELTEMLGQASVYHHRRLVKIAKLELAGDFTTDRRTQLRSMRVDPWLVRQEKASAKLARNNFAKTQVASFFLNLFEAAAVKLDRTIATARKSEVASAEKLGAKSFEPSPSLLSLQRLRLYLHQKIEGLASPSPVAQESPSQLASELGIAL